MGQGYQDINIFIADLFFESFMCLASCTENTYSAAPKREFISVFVPWDL